MNKCTARPKFILQQQKTGPDQPIFEFLEDGIEQTGSARDNLFSSFLYRDHVTRYRYQISKLKSTKRLKTCPNQMRSSPSSQLTFLNEELKLLRIIKQTRNKELIQNYRIKSLQKNRRAKLSVLNQQQEVDKVKRKIRRQVLNLNHEFLREYLYHQQPFNKMLLQINRYSNAGIINQPRINELKEKILKCMEQRRDQNRHLGKEHLEEKHKKSSFNKSIKKQKEKQVEKKFEQIWEQLRKQIGSKVRMEGEYNLYGKIILSHREMCMRIKCKKCGKPSWAGCGAHVEDVLADVPPENRCKCKNSFWN